MHIHPLSDLHLEARAYALSGPPDTDLVVLLGDIAEGVRGIQAAAVLFNCPVLYVPGNHEFYRGHLTRTLLKMEQAAAATGGKVLLLNQATVHVGDVRILGTTGWTDYTSTGNQPLAAWDAEQTMNDFRQIRIGSEFRRIRANDLIERSMQERTWLETELAKPFDGKTIVATHHAPTMQSIAQTGQAGSHLSAAYANRWEHLLDQADVWLHGHTHQAVDYRWHEDGARVVSNPRGYPGEATGFNPNLLIEV